VLAEAEAAQDSTAAHSAAPRKRVAPRTRIAPATLKAPAASAASPLKVSPRMRLRRHPKRSAKGALLAPQR